MKIKSETLIDIFDNNGIVICQKFMGAFTAKGTEYKIFRCFKTSYENYMAKYEGSKSENTIDLMPCDFTKSEMIHLLAGGELTYVYSEGFNTTIKTTAK